MAENGEQTPGATQGANPYGVRGIFHLCRVRNDPFPHPAQNWKNWELTQRDEEKDDWPEPEED